MEKFRAEGELPGDVTLKVCRAINGTSGGKQQMLMLREINDCSKVECRVIAPAGSHRGAMIDFTTKHKVFRHLLLHDDADETPILIAGAGIDAVAATTVNCPVAKTLLRPYRQKRLHMTAAESGRFAAGGNFQQRENSDLRQLFRLLNETEFYAKFSVAITISVLPSFGAS